MCHCVEGTPVFWGGFFVSKIAFNSEKGDYFSKFLLHDGRLVSSSFKIIRSDLTIKKRQHLLQKPEKNMQ